MSGDGGSFAIKLANEKANLAVDRRQLEAVRRGEPDMMNRTEEQIVASIRLLEGRVKIMSL